MLDEDWLKSLRFELPDDFIGMRGNIKVTGLAGVGTTSIVFNVKDESGEKLVMKIYHKLSFFLKEIPPGLIKGGECNINRINQKLYYLIGNPLIDEMCYQYKRLYAYIFSFIYEVYQTHKENKLTDMTDEHFAIFSFIYKHKLNEESSFILKTPGIKRKLNDLMSLSLNPINLSKKQSDLISRMLFDQKQTLPLEDGLLLSQVLGQALRSRSLWFNFPFEINVDRKQIIPWAESILASIEKLVPELPYLRPESIISNPLYIWGAAVMDGLITEEAMPIAISFIHEKFGNLYVQCLEKDAGHEIYRIKKFAQFCSHAGYLFPIYDKDGNMI
jgi:hypothetical protein